ncbi:MAG: hypothetical protein ACXVZP_07430 [Gaiellaceae bacterium]
MSARADDKPRGWIGAISEPRLLVALGVIAAVCAFQLWISPSNPPGFVRDEAALALNAYTIGHSGRDQYGAVMPLFFRSFSDYKSPEYVYVLAGVFRVTGPSQAVARGLGAVLGLAAMGLLGLLALRLTRSRLVALAVFVLAGTTPWLFEVGRVAFEVTMEPLLICLLLLAVASATRRAGWGVLSGIPVGLALGSLIYVYAAGRLLAPLFTLALVALAGKGRWRWLLSAWGTLALSGVPFLVYWLRHPGALSARFRATTFITKDTSTLHAAHQALSNYVHDWNLVHWLTSGDLAGADSLLVPVVALAAVGLVLAVRRWRSDLWLRYVVVALVLAPIPAALGSERYHPLRLVPVPILMLALTIPALDELARRLRRTAWIRIASVCLAIVGAAQFAHFVHVYSSKGPDRRADFEADVPSMLATAFASTRILYVNYHDPWSLTQASWYAVLHDIPLSRLKLLPIYVAPPPGSIVVGRFPACDYPCTKFATAEDYWLARTPSS